jgi:hypothetical protein
VRRLANSMVGIKCPMPGLARRAAWIFGVTMDMVVIIINNNGNDQRFREEVFS